MIGEGKMCTNNFSFNGRNCFVFISNNLNTNAKCIYSNFVLLNKVPLNK